MDYFKEPFNFKLCILNMLEKWYQFAICTIIGSVLFGGSYFLYKVTFAPAKEFQASATYYIEYAKDPVLEEPYSYFNEYTLNSWITTDVFTNRVLPLLGTELSVEQLDAYVDLTVPSDVRVMSLTVTTSDPILSMKILEAYDAAFVEFANTQREINEIRVQGISKEANQIKADIRTQRAFVLGAVLGLFSGSMYIILKYLLDDGIFLPAVLAKRHGLTVFGTDVSEELQENIIYAVHGKKRIAVTSIGDAPALPQVVQKLQGFCPEVEWVMVPAMVQCPEAADELRKCDGTIVTVVSEKDKSTAIARALRYYEQQQISVMGAVLWNVNQKLLNRYEK